MHALIGPAKTPIDRSEVWFVIAPSVGTELQTTASSMALISELAGPLHATLVATRPACGRSGGTPGPVCER